VPIQYPRVGGQHQDYTVAQLTAFKTGARNNSIQMTALAKRMSDEEMKAVADYIAGLK
jgi:cytochrome c553